MNMLTYHITYFVFVMTWIAGVIIAKGFWSTFLACIIPFWAQYLVIEQILIQYFPWIFG